MARKPIGRPRTAVPAATTKEMTSLGNRIAKQRAAVDALADETDTKVTAWHAAGVPITQISEATGLTPKTIRACLARTS